MTCPEFTRELPEREITLAEATPNISNYRGSLIIIIIITIIVIIAFYNTVDI